jgi:MoxR-like ATPase
LVFPILSRLPTKVNSTLFSSAQELAKKLKDVGYVADDTTVSTIYLSSVLQRSVLLEGVPGAGKTQLAYAIAHVAENHAEKQI